MYIIFVWYDNDIFSQQIYSEQNEIKTSLHIFITNELEQTLKNIIFSLLFFLIF